MNGAKRLDALQGLRGLAATLVVLSHLSSAGLNLHPSLMLKGFGTLGVYLFFTLSAFLLTRQFLLHPPTSAGDARWWSAYAVRRIARIYPVFTLALLSTLASPVIAVALGGPQPISILRHLALLDGSKIFWAIPVEMKFYAVLPALLLATRAVCGSSWVAALMPLAVAAAAARILPPELDPRRSIRLVDFQAIFLLGSAGAWAWNAIEQHRPAPAVRIALDVLACVTFAAILAPALLPFPLAWSRQATEAIFVAPVAWHGAAWTMFLLSALAARGLVARALESPLLQSAGLVSFSMYLWHMPVIEVLRRSELVMGRPVWMATLMVLAAVVAVSGLSYAVLERPVLRAVSRWSSRIPQDVATCEAMQHRMGILEGIARGEKAVEEGRSTSQSEAKKRLARWLK